jgi:hypothetical protein
MEGNSLRTKKRSNGSCIIAAATQPTTQSIRNQRAAPPYTLVRLSLREDHEETILVESRTGLTNVPEISPVHWEEAAECSAQILS